MTFEALMPWFLCGAIIVCFVSIGLFAGRDIDRTSDEFLTGGKRFGALIIALSIFATSNTGFMFVGAIGSGYSMGVAALWVPLAWFAGEVVFWQLFPVKIHRVSQERNPISIPDYISRSVSLNGRRAVQISAGIVIFIAMLPYIIGQNIAAGKALSSITNLDPQMSVLLAGGFMTFMALVYCLRGGLRSSITTNAVQGTVILCIGIVLLFALSIQILKMPTPVGAILAANPSAFDPFAIHAPLLAIAFFFGAGTASFGSAMSLPTMLTRLSVAASANELRSAKWLCLGMSYIFWGAMVLMGMMLSAVVPMAADPEQSLFVFAGETSPWLLGLTLGGVAGLILSTIDGSTMVGGSALSDDMANAKAASPNLRRSLRILGLSAFAGSALIAAVFLATSSVYDVILFGVSALAGGIGPAFMISTLKWRTNTLAMVVTILIGMTVAIGWAVAGLSEYVAEALPSFIAGLLCHWALTRRRETKIETSH